MTILCSSNKLSLSTKFSIHSMGLYRLGISLFVLLITSLTTTSLTYAQTPVKELAIKAGTYRPLYLSANSPLVKIFDFYIDEVAVTNERFYQFLQTHPNFKKQSIAPIFADLGYLKHWQKVANEYKPKPSNLNKPVVNVSWYAATQYCQAQNKHLPTVEQWEYVAQASSTQRNGSLESNYNQRILEWYSKSTSSQGDITEVGRSMENYWGVKDMHGLIWEWTENFNNNLVTGESRGDSNFDQNLFCGSAAIGAVDPSDYAAFMRYGFRSSLEAKFTVSSLGFRCARD